MEILQNYLALTTILLLVLANPCLAAKTSKQTCPIDFIRDSCRATKYPKQCYNSLSTYTAKILTNEKVLTRMAFSQSLSEIILASSRLHNVAKNPSLRAQEVHALQECIQKLKDAEHKLRKCIREMGPRVENSSFQIRMTNLKKLLSSAMADVNHGRDAIVKNVVHKIVAVAGHRILHVIQVTSNAMELLDKYASKHDQH